MICCSECQGGNNQHRSYCSKYKRRRYQRKNISSHNEERVYWAALGMAMERLAQPSQPEDGSGPSAILAELGAEVQLRVVLRDKFRIDLDEVGEAARNLYNRALEAEREKERAEKRHQQEIKETIERANKLLGRE